ncbi:hypothetical protein [Spiroplasma endosymbiont of Lasioglossum malachurum]
MNKEKLIYYLDNEFMELLKDDISNWKLKLIMKLQEKIQNGEFD